MNTLFITIDEKLWETMKDANYWKFEEQILLLYRLSKKENKYTDVVYQFPILSNDEINKLNDFNCYDSLFLSNINENGAFSISFSEKYLSYLDESIDEDYVPRDQETIHTPKKFMFIHDPFVPSSFK